MSLSVSSGRDHWAAPVCYVLDAPAARLLFATDPMTRHGGLLTLQPGVVATVSGQGASVDHLSLVLWELVPADIKATDNRVHFGHKEGWGSPAAGRSWCQRDLS